MSWWQALIVFVVVTLVLVGCIGYVIDKVRGKL